MKHLNRPKIDVSQKKNRIKRQIKADRKDFLKSSQRESPLKGDSLGVAVLSEDRSLFPFKNWVLIRFYQTENCHFSQSEN
jgi:hypothetical protein